MTELIIAVLAVLAVVGWIFAILSLAADEVIEESAALARMVAGVAHLNPVAHPQCDGSPS